MPRKRIKATLSKLLKDHPIVVLGYGSQGAAQAQNLRDSGIDVVVGLPNKSKSRKRARRDGFKLLTPIEAIKTGRVISVLIPDHLQGRFFSNETNSGMLKGKTLIFAHGL